jgi:hypothetical protein
MPPKHQWATPAKACACNDLDAMFCHGPTRGAYHGGHGAAPCPCACHGGPEPEPMLAEEPIAAPSRATDGATRETWELAEEISGAASLKRSRLDVDPMTWERTCHLVKAIRGAVRAEVSRLPRLVDRPELERAKPARVTYPALGSLELSPEVVDVLERAAAAMVDAGGISWETFLTECRRTVRATGGAS